MDELNHQALLTEVAHAADDAAGGRVLIFGSPPPQGRDLDLLAHKPEEAAIAASLQGAGLRKRGMKWAAFRGCAAVGVELVPAVDWQLPAEELGSLFAEAEALPGYRHLVVPAPHHLLLIAARRVARAGQYSDRLRARVAASTEAAPSAWEEAERRAPSWRAAHALSSMRALHEEPSSRGRRAALRALMSRARAIPAPRHRAARRVLRRVGRGPAIVALSGLDGAGKSFQAVRLQAALDQLDVRAVVIWPPAANVLFQANPALKRRLFAVLRTLGRSDRKRRTAALAPPAQESPMEPLPRQRAVVAHALALVVALVQAWAFRRGARRVRRGADLLIYDRYALDSIVYLRHRWGHGRPFPLQSALIDGLSKRPQRAFFLSVPPEVAYARKQDFPLDNLRERAELYERLYTRLGCIRLDAERSAEELCAEIASSVWECLD